MFIPVSQTYSRPVEQLVKYMIDVAMGMHYLSEKGLVHRVCVDMSEEILLICFKHAIIDFVMLV